MSLVDLEVLRNKVRLCYDRYEKELERLEIDWARKEGRPPEELKGQARQLIIEAQVRAYILDPILQALGWQVSAAANMVVEDAVEPSNANDNRRFLDYHGRDQGEGTNAASLLIVEAKRPNVALPETDSSAVARVIAEALGQFHGGKEITTVTKGWAERLTTLVDYASRVKRETKQAPKTVAITNGDWFIIFENVEAALLSKAPSFAAITVYTNTSAILQDIERFWRFFSYERLSEHVPPQDPAALQRFVTGPTEKVEAVFAIDVSYTTHGTDPEQQPSMAGQVLALVRVAGERWIKFRHDPQVRYVELHHEGERFDATLQDFADRAKQLLDDLRRYADVLLLSAADAEALLKKQGWEKPHLCKSKDGKNFQLIMGEAPFFIVTQSTWDGCPYHDFYYSCKFKTGKMGLHSFNTPWNG